MHDRPNPMRELLHQQLGIDAFALDGEPGALEGSWQDEPRAEPLVRLSERPKETRFVKAA